MWSSNCAKIVVQNKYVELLWGAFDLFPSVKGILQKNIKLLGHVGFLNKKYLPWEFFYFSPKHTITT